MTEVPDDRAAHRDWLLSFVPVRDGMFIADLGCGAGDDLLSLAQRHPGVAARFVGLDTSGKAIANATAHSRDDPRIAFADHDLDRPLPFETSSIHAVFTNNLVECLADRVKFAGDIGRVLRPGGTLVAAHWDWDTQVFDGHDKGRIRRLMHAFADWQQPWMKRSDGWMGRRLWGTFEATGLFRGKIQTRSLTNTIYASPWYGHARAQDLRSLLQRAQVSEEDVGDFLEEQATLQAEGRYFYSVTGMAYVGTRNA